MDDLISRSDAIGAVKEERFPIDSDYAEGFMAALDKVEWILKEWLPSAEPERKKGRWLPEYGDVNAKAHYCSACNFYYTTSPEKMNYCPYCGAKMEKMPPLKVRSSKQTVIERWQNRIGEDES